MQSGAKTKGERTRAMFIDVAADLLQRQGLRATGINQIIAESGAPRGSFYYHFPRGKDELASEALRTAAACPARNRSTAAATSAISSWPPWLRPPYWR